MVTSTPHPPKRRSAPFLVVAGLIGAGLGHVLAVAFDPGPICPGGGISMCLALGGGLSTFGYFISSALMAAAAAALCAAALAHLASEPTRWAVVGGSHGSSVAAGLSEFLLLSSL